MLVKKLQQKKSVHFVDEYNGIVLNSIGQPDEFTDLNLVCQNMLTDEEKNGSTVQDFTSCFDQSEVEQTEPKNRALAH